MYKIFTIFCVGVQFSFPSNYQGKNYSQSDIIGLSPRHNKDKIEENTRKKIPPLSFEKKSHSSIKRSSYIVLTPKKRSNSYSGGADEKKSFSGKLSKKAGVFRSISKNDTLKTLHNLKKRKSDESLNERRKKSQSTNFYENQKSLIFIPSLEGIEKETSEPINMLGLKHDHITGELKDLIITVMPIDSKNTLKKDFKVLESLGISRQSALLIDCERAADQPEDSEIFHVPIDSIKNLNEHQDSCELQEEFLESICTFIVRLPFMEKPFALALPNKPKIAYDSQGGFTTNEESENEAEGFQNLKDLSDLPQHLMEKYKKSYFAVEQPTISISQVDRVVVLFESMKLSKGKVKDSTVMPSERIVFEESPEEWEGEIFDTPRPRNSSQSPKGKENRTFELSQVLLKSETTTQEEKHAGLSRTRKKSRYERLKGLLNSLPRITKNPGPSKDFPYTKME